MADSGAAGGKTWASVASSRKKAQAGKEDSKKAGEATSDEAAANSASATENLLDALASGEAAGDAVAKARSARSNMIQAGDRPVSQQMPGHINADKLLGHWVDSNGNAVHVLNTDAYDVHLSARLTKPPRPDIHLSVKPVVLGAGWQCGHSLLDPVWTNATQLHWVSMDGRVSVWVRPDGTEDEAKGEKKEQEKGADGGAAAIEAATASAAATVAEDVPAAVAGGKEEK
mmetsp:Transcript_38416/g.99237  ORF Transcript_38416/g.99237 Transcript_38416/m.99237 type:complete len:229 (-) Transcript_38416:12-698(-)